MAIQLRQTTRSNRLDQIDTDIGATGLMRIYTGAQPTNCQTANSGTLLAEITLPNPAFQSASAGSMQKSASAWQDTSADGTGTAAHFRIYNSATPGDGTTTTILQGSVGQGTGDLSLDNTSINSGQQVTITTFTLTDGNA